jgi:outer membrane protein TolC
MSEIINLRVARKRADRQRSQARAATARVSHGMSKAERTLAKANIDKIRRELDEHRTETGEADEIAGR